MGLWNDLMAGEDATQSARREIMADSIGKAVARSMGPGSTSIDLSGVSRALEGGLGSIEVGIGNLASGMSDLAASLGTGMGEITAGLKDVGYGIDSMHADFNIALGDLLWQMQQQSESLTTILDTLRAPVGTEAYEYRMRGEDSYRNGWYEESLSDLLKSAELNFRDFSVHRTIGNIYFYHNDPPRFDAAREAYEKAAKYSRPRDNRQCAEAHLFAAFACMGMRDWQAARDHCLEALNLNSSLFEAHYTCSQILAILGDATGCLDHLTSAITGDPRYFIQASFDRLLDSFREQVDQLLATKAEQVQRKIQQCLDSAGELKEQVQILTQSEKARLLKIIEGLSAIVSSGNYPAMVNGARSLVSEFNEISTGLLALANEKEYLEQTIGSELQELKHAVYVGPQWVIEYVKPGIDSLLQSAEEAYSTKTLEGYRKAQKYIKDAWVEAKEKTINRYTQKTGSPPADKTIECVLQRREVYDKQQAAKKEQELRDRREYWRAEGKCLECGKKLAFLDRVRGMTFCPEHRSS